MKTNQKIRLLKKAAFQDKLYQIQQNLEEPLVNKPANLVSG